MGSVLVVCLAGAPVSVAVIKNKFYKTVHLFLTGALDLHVVLSTFVDYSQLFH